LLYFTENDVTENCAQVGYVLLGGNFVSSHICTPKSKKTFKNL